MQQAYPNTYLEPGKEIFMKDKKGIVLETIQSFDQFNNPINYFKIKLTHKLEKYSKKWKQLKKPVIQNCNYAFIFFN